MVVHAANVHDSKGAADVTALLRYRFNKLVKIVADAGYGGELVEKTKTAFGNSNIWGRYSLFGEQRFRRNFEQWFDFFGFNKALAMSWIGNRNAVAFDPSFIHKSGKQTPGSVTFGRGVQAGHRGELKYSGFL